MSIIKSLLRSFLGLILLHSCSLLHTNSIITSRMICPVYIMKAKLNALTFLLTVCMWAADVMLSMTCLRDMLRSVIYSSAVNCVMLCVRV